MADAVRVDASEVLQALQRAQTATALEGARDSVETAAVRALAATAPRRTGQLARSARPIRAGGVVAAVRPTARYAGPVNSGVPSRNMRATRFVEEAARSIEQQVSVVAERYLAREVRG